MNSMRGQGTIAEQPPGPKVRSRRKLAIASVATAILLAALVGLVALSVISRLLDIESARGIVMSVESPSILDIEGLTVLTSDDQTLSFVVDEDSDLGLFTPSHLLQHGLEGEPVTVYFKKVGDDRVVTKITD